MVFFYKTDFITLSTAKFIEIVFQKINDIDLFYNYPLDLSVQLPTNTE